MHIHFQQPINYRLAIILEACDFHSAAPYGHSTKTNTRVRWWATLIIKVNKFTLFLQIIGVDV